MFALHPCHVRSYFATSGMRLKSITLVILTSLAYFPSAALAKEQANKGKFLLERNGCNTCHSINGKGGCLAPPYDGLAKRRSKEFVLSRITNTKEAVERFEKLYPESELMPHPRISSADAKSIADYLLTLPAPKAGFKATPHIVTKDMTNIDLAGNLENGRRLFFEKGCSACHSVSGIGGQFAPKLDGVGQREGKDYLAKKMSAAELLKQQGSGLEYAERGTTMPPSNLSKKDMADIAEYLMSIPGNKPR